LAELDILRRQARERAQSMLNIYDVFNQYERLWTQARLSN
jgi:hypothetical protein